MNHGGESYEAVVKRHISPRRQIRAKLDFIDLQNGAYLFFLRTLDNSKLSFVTRPRSKVTQRIDGRQNKARVQISNDFIFELLLLSSNCNSMRFPPEKMQNESTIRHTAQKLSHSICIPSENKYKELVKNGSPESDYYQAFQRQMVSLKYMQQPNISSWSIKAFKGKHNDSSKLQLPISMPNLHFIGDQISTMLFKFKPYYIRNVGSLKTIKEPLHDTTYYEFYTLLLGLITKLRKDETQFIVFSNSMNDVSSDIHSDYYMSLGQTMNRLIHNLYFSQPFTNYNLITILLNGPHLSLKNDLNCETKMSAEDKLECERISKYYSHERMNLLNDIYQTIASRYEHVYMINVSLMSNEGSWFDVHSSVKISDPILTSKIRDWIWKSILEIAMNV